MPIAVTARVEIESISRVSAATRFEARVLAVVNGAKHPLLNQRLRLYWHQAPILASGEHWRLQIRAKPPHGMANEGGFDYMRWLFAKKIVATGSVRSGERLQSQANAWPQALRQRIRKQLDAHSAGPLLRALVLADQQALTDEHWRVLRNTGTVHLFVVSGLHVALFTGAACALCLLLARTTAALRRRGDADWLACAVALMLAAGYVLLIGVGLPALRAWLMAAAGTLLYLTGQARQRSAVLLWALCAVLVLDPLAALLPGTWLSFVAVASLQGYWQTHYGRVRPFSALLRSQVVLFVALAPVLLLFNTTPAPVGLVANLLAVPLVSLLLLPLAFAAAVLALFDASLAKAPIALAGELSLLLMAMLEQLSRWQLWQPVSITPLRATSFLLASICAARFLGHWSMLMVASSVLLLLAKPSAEPLPKGTFEITAFDVGQGAAMLVRSGRHQLLFDAAPAFPGGMDLGRTVVLPALQRLHIQRLDALVVSHADLDHAGGAPTILAALAPSKVWYSNSAQYVGALRCQVGARWRWDGVWFEFVHPPVATSSSDSDNARSCVLHIRGSNGSALLTGDINSDNERALLQQWYAPVDFLQVPHHGSRSSSSSMFVRLLRPKIAVVSAGRHNRYGHPSAEILPRYASVGTLVLNTARAGAITWRSDQAWQAQQQRSARSAYWDGG